MVLRPSPAEDRAAAEAAFAHLGGASAAPAAMPMGDLLLGYQARTLRTLFDGVSLLVIEKSRRIGLTWGLAAYAVLKAAAQPAAGGMNAWYMGYDMEMAREFIDTCAMWARAFGIATEAVDEEMLDEGEVQAFRIRFASGFKIVALPSVPRALRGKQGLVIIDEAAFHKDLAEVLKAAIALLMWGGQVVVVSTHDGVANPFNLLLDDVRAGRRKGGTITITFNDAIDAGLYERVKLTADLKGRAILAKEAWIADIRDTYGDDAEEELDCIPKAGSGSWLSPESIAACEHPDAGRPELYAGGHYFMGRDVARRRDNPVIWGLEAVGDVLWLRDRWIKPGSTFAEQDDAAAELIAHRRMLKYLIDQTGMGEKVVEDEQRKYGTSRCTGVLLTGPNRLEMAIEFKDRFDRGLIRIPPRPEIRVDLRAIKKKGGIGGSISLVNEGDVHADEFWAGALASLGAAMPRQEYAYHPVQGRELADQSALARRRYENEHGGGGLGGGFRGFRW
ncbi:MAG: terminase family protein [Pseudomonadota bacterium]